MDNLVKKLIFSLLMLFMLQDISAQILISGKVTESDGAPLPWATVVVKGTDNGTETKNDGSYSIEVPDENSVLVFSFLGYGSEEVTVGERRTIDVVLGSDSQLLSEVVIVGYGTQKKSDVTGAIVSVESEDLEKVSVVNAVSALQGKAAGVSITSNSGTPGGSVKVRVRGIGTTGDAAPLYVVDGFPVNDIEFLNPTDISSIEVLKDASASAIYGARGANGVILVTTKRGEANTSNISFTTYIGYQEIVNQPNLMNGPEYYQTMQQMYENGGGTFNLISTTNTIPYAGDTTRTTDWYGQMVQVAPMRNYELSFNGGTERLRYLISGSIHQQDGSIVGSSFDRQTFRLNLNSKVNNWLEVGTNVSMSNNTQRSVIEGSIFSGTILNTFRADPLTPIRNDSLGQYYIPAYQDMENPVAAIDYDHFRSNYFRSVSNVYAQISFLNNFTFKSSFGFDLTNGNTSNFSPERYFLGSIKYDVPESVVSGSKSRSQSWLNENILTFNKAFNDHNLTVLAGYTMQEWESDWISGTKNGTYNDNATLQYFDAANDPQTLSGRASENAMVSILGRVNYAYAGKYLLTGSVRRDGSSRFGQNNRFGVFPSVSLGWNILGEDFMSSVPVLSTLKLRAGWGQIGNDRIGNYTYNAGVSFSSYNSYILGGGNAEQYQVFGAAPDNFGNPFLRWETVESTNIGLDYGLFEGRITGSLEFYQKNTKDMLVREPVPEYVGFLVNPMANVGDMLNRGVESSITYRNRDRAFKYDVTFNIAANRNELVSLGNGQPITAGSIQAGAISRNDVGQPIGSFFGFITDGIFQNEEETAAGVQPDAVPGDIRYLDLNADGVIDDNDKTFIGNPLPDFEYGFNLNFEYKNFDLNMFWQGTYGNQIFNASNWYLWHTSEQYNRSRDLLNSWDGEGSTDKFPRLSTQDRNGNNLISDRYIEDGSYLRLRNLQLGYTLPQDMISRVGIQKARIYISGQNLLTITDYSGLDPEIGNLFSDLSAGIDLGTYPQVRILMFGARIVF